MSNKARWIRTTSGWAGRKGFIFGAEKGNGGKYGYREYLGIETVYSDLISELKKLADQE